MGENYYERLRITRDATPDEIREAYFRCVRETHPDQNPDPSAKEDFIKVQSAYEVLNDPKKRREYDATLPDTEYTAPLISTSILYSKTELPRLDENQLLYVLLDINCTASPQESDLFRSHICFVIDKSTSMQGSRIGMVKANLTRLLQRIKSKDLVSIVAFSDKAELILSPSAITDPVSVEAKINKIHCSGGTEIYKGLKAGIDLLWNSGNQAFNKHLVLLTDGHTYGDEDHCYTLAKAAFQQGITISGLGIGHEWNDPFLDKLAAITGGSTMFVRSPEDLHNYLNQQISSAEIIYARGLTYEYECDREATLRYVFRIQPDIMPLEFDGKIPLGDLYYGKRSQYIMELLVKPVNKSVEDVPLIKGRVKMDVCSKATQSARIKLNLSIKVKDNLEKENPPSEIVRALSKLTLYQMQERSRRDVNSGNYLPAVKRMHYLASKILAQGDQKLAKTVLLEAERINDDHRFSEDGDKRLKYGTKALFLLPEPKVRSS